MSMSKIANRPLQTPSADDPRRSFESAIAQIQHRGERPLSQTPIADRGRPPMPGDPGAEKQALTDAARALARLWNVSPALVR
jgi:hypothetical protein